jgi:hypothetical protein
MKQLRSYRRLICEASASTTVDNLFSLSLSLSQCSQSSFAHKTPKHANRPNCPSVPLILFLCACRAFAFAEDTEKENSAQYQPQKELSLLHSL